MVIIQVLAFGRVQDNREGRRMAKAAKAEREKARKEKLEEERKLSLKKTNGHARGSESTRGFLVDKTQSNGGSNGIANGKSNMAVSIDELKLETESEDGSSVTETSEEEMIV